MDNKQVMSREQNIVLIGFMGVGKTTVGQILASKLDRPFIDMDQEIEEEYCMPTTEIFKEMGEETFREKEKNVISNFCKKKGYVLSLGGGAFIQKEIRQVCLANGIVVHLDISWEEWEERMSMLADERPVLQGKSPEEVKELFFERQHLYAEHHYRISTDKLTEEEVADKVIAALKSEEN